MELPKNVTQIGEVGKDCKIYVEDYVVSYIKQLNRLAVDKGMAVALYGRRCAEKGVAYFFLYGAGRLSSLQREVRHLSQAQRQEIESLRRKFFPDYVFLGYRLLNGEMVEGFHICEQEICRYISGYAQFYEKNDSMLAYMLAVRDEAQPEQIDQDKYEEVKRRQEERRAAAARSTRNRRTAAEIRGAVRKRDAKVDTHSREPVAFGKLQGMKLATIGVFALLCLVGISGMQERARQEGIEDIQTSAKQWLEQLGESELPGGSEEAVPANAGVQKDTLVMEDKLEQALLEENGRAQETTAGPDSSEPDSTEETTPGSDGSTGTAGDTSDSGTSVETASESDAAVEQATVQIEEPAVETVQTPEAVAYVVQGGDTLTGISVRQYGSDVRVADICSLNHILNPDDIKEGQIIMLPK